MGSTWLLGSTGLLRTAWTASFAWLTIGTWILSLAATFAALLADSVAQADASISTTRLGAVAAAAIVAASPGFRGFVLAEGGFVL